MGQHNLLLIEPQMTNQTGIYVGIDISKDHLDIYIDATAETLQLANTQEGVEALITLLRPLSIERVVLEATGGLERLVVSHLSAVEIPVSLANPRRVRAYGISLGRAKTDALDAKLLAEFGRSAQLPCSVILDASSQELVDMVRRRRQLVEMRVAESNRLSRAAKTIQADIQAHLEELTTRIEQLDERIEQRVTQPYWENKRKILSSFKGVGPVIASVCLSELPELGQLSEKQIARLVGLAPMNRDSGQFRGKRMIEGGRAHVRGALYMAALVASCHNPVIRDFYTRLLERGKTPKVALVACMRKILVILNAIIRDNTPWVEPTLESS